MSALRNLGRLTGWTCAAIGGVQLLGGTRAEPGMGADATVDSHVRFMGPVFAGYGLGWLDAASGPEPDLGRMRVLAGLMALGGVGRLATRATLGRPHRFHDALLAIELAAPVVVEVLARRDPARTPTG
ncbi:DUF4345 domain-containing protein [Luteipulveratus halotolerans]|uniref:DUF4345 domain-containing protein n=1 Tax=Luteipulveratus halotolerans TaxID=1631356 RepID=A0A0L6CQ07_9MICO|nr:DUF4345 domain-containing protein [Luteipulveratus halotolerans]KNX39613.1 hypothetical protein VV01_19520 [Luteipulveratus halotolerans]